MTETEVRQVRAPAPAALAGMTFPAYRRLLSLERTSRHPEQGDPRQIDPLALAAWHGGRPVGLVLAELPATEASSPELLSVFVEPGARRQGVASALLGAAERRVRERGYREIGAVYTTGKPEIGYLERIFARHGWATPEARALSVRFTPAAARGSAMFAERRMRTLARGLEIFPWSALTAEEREEMRRSNDERRWIVPALEPWRFDRCGCDDSSVAARYRGRVAGWVINHRVSAQVVRFTCSFMRKDLSRRARILPLYAAALERLRSSPYRYCSFVTPLAYDGMVGLIRRWIVPFASFVGETRGTRLRFPVGSASTSRLDACSRAGL